jgi:hypothetical protein
MSTPNESPGPDITRGRTEQDIIRRTDQVRAEHDRQAGKTGPVGRPPRPDHRTEPK